MALLAVPAAAGRAGDDAMLERVATIIAPYCLVGWDTGGDAEPWFVPRARASSEPGRAVSAPPPPPHTL